MAEYMVCVAFGDRYIVVDALNQNEARNKAVEEIMQRLVMNDLEVYATDADEINEDGTYVFNRGTDVKN